MVWNSDPFEFKDPVSTLMYKEVLGGSFVEFRKTECKRYAVYAHNGSEQNIYDRLMDATNNDPSLWPRLLKAVTVELPEWEEKWATYSALKRAELSKSQGKKQ